MIGCRWLAVGLLGLVLAGCGAHHYPAVRPAPWTVKGHPQSEFTLEEQARITDNCPMGMPRLDPNAEWGSTSFIIREGYVLEHSSALKIPVWVCEGVASTELHGNAERKDRFRPDTLLPEGERSELKDYKGSGYDRGHMAPAGNQNAEQRLKDETFFLSNMTPQEGPFNQQIWRELEDLVRSWLDAHGAGWVVTGSMFYEEEEEDEQTADGFIDYFVIGPSLVAVPTHFFKLVVAQDSAEQVEAIGFVIENRGHSRPFDWSEHIRAIDWIEARAGMDLLPELDVITAQELEATPSPIWNE
jgi:DNA/RNA endonuclease G (NUC1)